MAKRAFQSAASIAAVMQSCDQRGRADVRHASPEPAGDLRLRRWDASETTRLNSAHWTPATGATLNEDLVGTLNTIRARCAHEASTNGIVEGMINTYAVDLVGRNGPTLAVVSDDNSYNTALEQIWAEVAECPDANGELSLAESLQRDVWLWFTCGEHLYIETNDPRATTPVQVRWATVDPRRLDTDPRYLGDALTAMGVRRSRTGRPLAYTIADLNFQGAYTFWNLTYSEYSADEVIHQFKRFEPLQVRGVPYLASTLQVAADLRDFDVQVLDAARLAASQSLFWYTDHPDLDPIQFDSSETQDIKRNQQQVGPAGWKPMGLTPTQPGPQYVDFRLERLRELGRPVSMPLMKILLGSERHNFASARMDNQNYQIALGVDRGRTERQTLNRMVNAVAAEASLVRRPGTGSGYWLPPRPRRVQYVWTWPMQPHVDPIKEANAQRVRMLETRTLTFAQACAENGVDEDAVLASWKRTFGKLAEAGLPADFLGAIVTSAINAGADEGRSMVSVLNRMHHEGLLTPEIVSELHETLDELAV